MNLEPDIFSWHCVGFGVGFRGILSVNLTKLLKLAPFIVGFTYYKW